MFFFYCKDQDFLYVLLRYQLAVEDDPHMKGDYTAASNRFSFRLVEDDPHMKGDYTTRTRVVLNRSVEDDPHMKGDYTLTE